jgi:hypothetical protein
MPRELSQPSHDNQPFQMNNPNNTDVTEAVKSRSTAFADASLGVKRLAILLAPTIGFLIANITHTRWAGLFVSILSVWAAVRGIDWVIRGFLYEKK